MPRLLVETPDEPPKTVELRDGLTAGRNETAGIILLDTLVSRQHLRFRRGPAGDYVVLDEQSSHGTRVNGKPTQSHLLTDGDVIEVGRVRITFIDPIEASIVVRVKDASPPERARAYHGGGRRGRRALSAGRHRRARPLRREPAQKVRMKRFGLDEEEPD
jgi:pSer/pThr/pTyr-binding forkhead associated (FHA) protein